MYKKILVAIDDSATSRTAARSSAQSRSPQRMTIKVFKPVRSPPRAHLTRKPLVLQKARVLIERYSAFRAGLGSRNRDSLNLCLAAAIDRAGALDALMRGTTAIIAEFTVHGPGTRKP